MDETVSLGGLSREATPGCSSCEGCYTLPLFGSAQ